MPENDDSGLDAIDAIPETEAPASETPAPASEQAPPAPSEGAQPRDDAGRFTSPAPQEEQPAAKAADAPPPETPGEPQPEAEPAADEQYEPLRFRADGQDVEIPGSAVGEDGAYIPKDALPLVTRLLTQGKTHEGSFRQRLSEAARDREAAQKQVEAAQAQAQAILHSLDQVFTGDEAAVLAFINNYRTEWPVLKAQSEAAATKVQADAYRQQLDSVTQERQQAALRPVMQDALQGYTVQIGRELGLADDDIRALVEELGAPELEAVLFVRAPEGNADGFQPGELAVNLNLIRQRAQTLQRVVGRYRQPTATGAKAPAPKPKVPPAVSAKGGQAPAAPKKKLPEFKDAKEANEYIFDHLEEFAEET